MKCIDKRLKTVSGVLCISFILNGCSGFGADKNIVADYEMEQYNNSLYEGTLYADSLCVGDSNIENPELLDSGIVYSSALFDLEEKNVNYAYEMHKRVYPASTTKILTALVALNSSDLDEMVTIGKNGAAASFAADEQVCGLLEGDTLSMKSLLAGLILHSGNDSAVAIAEHVARSESSFVDMMNEQATKVMATNSHFVTSSGLHDENHYTTAYDLYLIFNQCIKNETFLEILSSSSYAAEIRGADGSMRTETWYPSNYYAKGEAALPENALILGGKTGYTGEAGNCLILLEEDIAGNPYISVVMGAETKPLLYENMTNLINTIPGTQ